MLGFIFFSLLVLLFVLLLRFLASLPSPIIAAILPANSTALVLTKRNTMGKDSRGNPVVNNDGGNVTNVIHAVPGKHLDRSDDPKDPMKWKMVDGDEPERGLLYHTLGIQLIYFFRYLRINNVRTFRYGRTDVGKEYEVMPKSPHTRFPFYSGQHDILAKNVESSGILRMNLFFNILYEETYPVKVRLYMADPYAVLTMKVKRVIIAQAGQIDAQELIQNDGLQDKFAEMIQKIATPEVLNELGITIKSVVLADVSYFDDDTTKLLELTKRTKIQNDADIAIAEKDKKVQMLANDADEDRIKRVIKPGAETKEMVSFRWAEAYEEQEHVITYAPGAGNTMIPLSSNLNEEKQEKVPAQIESKKKQKVLTKTSGKE